ncbi:cell death regulator Aven [Colossoma macropomum]|uniref:cell death regulator Aven n=1 Tax=Colossoma macropomum TaxID=42526 RepID=UPI001864FFB5|nr:cell death regulator Aven [Colossoma macropomum]
MEGRGGRARGGQWRRGGGGGAQDTGAPGERRGRGRGGHHRGRGRRDHYRGRGRGGGDGGAADFNRGQDEQDNKENLEEEMPDIYSRRKLESNWDRYEESEKEEVNDGVPVQRGTDYHVLLSSAGDSFTQFRFSEEKDWEMDSLAVNQVPALSVDLEALAQSLQELPLHKRLNLEADLVQVTTPVELPSVGVLHKVDANVIGGFKPPAPPYVSREPALGGSCPVKPVVRTSTSSQACAAVINPEDDADGELDLLLGLQKPVTELSIAEPRTSNPAEEPASPEKASVEEKKEEVVEVNQLKAEEEAERKKTEELKPESASVKQEMTEEDLEGWLDSMIS